MLTTFFSSCLVLGFKILKASLGDVSSHKIGVICHGEVLSPSLEKVG